MRQIRPLNCICPLWFTRKKQVHLKLKLIMERNRQMTNRETRRQSILNRVWAMCACISTAAIEGALQVDFRVVPQAIIQPGREGYVNVYFSTDERERIAGLFTT